MIHTKAMQNSITMDVYYVHWKDQLGNPGCRVWIYRLTSMDLLWAPVLRIIWGIFVLCDPHSLESVEHMRNVLITEMVKCKKANWKVMLFKGLCIELTLSLHPETTEPNKTNGQAIYQVAVCVCICIYNVCVCSVLIRGTSVTWKLT